jgi:orotate phosphoribosyltransferase
MHLTPTQDEVVALLRETGALREGHFQDPSGLHSNEYLQVPLALRHYQIHRTLSVGLARLLRANPEIRAITQDLSIVTPIIGGLPVAFGVCEALRAKRVYWAERDNANEPLHFRQFLLPEKGEQVVLVDDILRTGKKLSELRKLLEESGAEVVGLAVLIYQPFPGCASFGDLPLYYLAKLEARYAVDGAECEWCKSGVPLIKTLI